MAITSTVAPVMAATSAILFLSPSTGMPLIRSRRLSGVVVEDGDRPVDGVRLGEQPVDEHGAGVPSPEHDHLDPGLPLTRRRCMAALMTYRALVSVGSAMRPPPAMVGMNAWPKR